MSEMLPVQDDLDLPVSNIPRQELAKLSERAYLPFIKLCSADEDIAKFKEPGAWLLCRDAQSKQNITNVIEFLVVAARPLACHTTTTGIERYYDMGSKEYAEVKRLSEIPNHMGDWWGTDYLLWLRVQRQWCTWHASSETHRQRAEVLTGILINWEDDRKKKKAAIDAAVKSGDAEAIERAKAIVVPMPQAKMGSELVYYKRYNSKKWAATISPITTPFSEYPTFEDIRERSLKFQNPPKVSKETLNTEGADAPTPTRG